MKIKKKISVYRYKYIDNTVPIYKKERVFITCILYKLDT